jgi:uncharacterized protein (DUF608 family)
MTSNRPHSFMGSYDGEHLNHIAFPLGGLGAGMVCLEGVGAISHVSVRNNPELFQEPLIFAALFVETPTGNVSRVIEGPVPAWKLLFPWPTSEGSGKGQGGKSYGLPRFEHASFSARFPFATVKLSDSALPIDVTLTGWSPFIPRNADESGLPVAALEYTLANHSSAPVKGVY